MRGFQTPPAEMTNAARGNDQRRTRGLSSPHAAFFVSFFEETLFSAFGLICRRVFVVF